MTLLKFAKSTNDPNVAAALIERAADLKDRVDESTAMNPTPRPPDVDQGS